MLKHCDEPDQCSITIEALPAMADRIVIKKNFKYMLYPNAAQIVAMDGQLAEACRLTPR